MNGELSGSTRPAPTQAARNDANVESNAPGIFRLALLLGLLACALELAVLTFREFALGHERVWSDDLVWMAPPVYLVLFAFAGAVLHPFAKRSERARLVTVFLLTTAAATSALLVLPALHPLASVALGAGIATRVTTWARDRYRLNRVVRRTLAPITATLALAAVTAALWPVARERIMLARVPAAEEGLPNVVIVILDTVRAWNLSLYGYDRPTTPQLQRWAAHGVTFDRALATAPYTLPTHYSIFTGLYPGAMEAIKRRDYDEVVPESSPVLAEVLAQHGYATAGFVANLFYTTSEFGLDQGFARYEDFPVTLGQLALSTAPGRRITNNGRLRRLLGYHDILNRKSAERIVDDFLDWRAGVGERPFFAFLNLYDAHEPYLPPSPFEEQFVREPPKDGHFYDTNRVQRLFMRDLSERETRAQMDRYDGAIASIDGQLGRLFETLDRDGVLDNTIVIVTSDHGEEFMEHGKVGHVAYMYMSLLHVPLLIVAPSRTPSGLREDTPVSVADIPATILELAGLPVPSAMPGRSLSRFWQGPEPAAEPILAEADPGNNRKSVLDGRYHFIRNVDEPPELYDLFADPLEQRNLAAVPGAEAEVTRLEDVLAALLEASANGSLMAGPMRH